MSFDLGSKGPALTHTLPPGYVANDASWDDS